MKTITRKLFKSATSLVGGAALLAGIANAQTIPNFISVSATDEQAIRLTWASVSNEVYETDEADTLIDTNTGTITWNKLYDNYPSQGTNTFWLDTGNYNLSPQILHPKNMPTRFYRIVDLGPDTTSDEPSVSITSPTGGAAVGELTVTVVAQTDQSVLNGTKLYVDGQEMRSADTTTNYTDETGVTNYEVDTYNLNTCEWGNETHTLFATAECQSGNGDAVNSAPVATGHAVSAFVPVLFSNLITRISFSQPSFDPSSGQTQQVTAVFAANCNWTLTIRDANSNEVRTATGSGNTMQFNWDGTGDGETNLPSGIYYYYVNAQTNGLPNNLSSGGSGTGTTPPMPMLSMAEDDTQLYVVEDSGSILPLALFPPGYDTNGFNLIEAAPSEVRAYSQTLSSSSTTLSSSVLSSGTSSGSYHANGAAGGSSAGSQGSPASPQRPPTNPIEGISGLFGIAYDTYSANGTNVMSAPTIPNIPGVPGSYIAMDGYSGSSHLTYAPVPPFKSQANNFINEMQTYGWVNRINKADDQLSINDLRGSGTPFNNVSFGVLLCHGAYGNTQDYQAGLCKQMYFPITSGGSIQYLRLTEMNLGGSDPTNGLKWFAILACDSLHQANWNSMQNLGQHPYNGNLHLLCGANSVISANTVVLQYWARYMNYGRGSFSPMKVRDAYYQAAIDAYRGRKHDNTMVFSIAGDSACYDDYVEQGFNSAPQGSWTYDSRQVWP